MSVGLRQPRLRALADGVMIPGAISAQILSTAHATADRYRLTIAPNSAEIANWADITDTQIEIQFSLDGLSWSGLITAEIDQLRLDPLTGQVILEGRDLSSRLIDTRAVDTFANQTSSDVAARFASDAGLMGNIALTFTPIGVYWQLEHDQILLAAHCHVRSRWDLLAQLAAREGFDVWVSGNTLNFQPSNPDRSPTATFMPSDFLRMSLERSLTVARDISVTVQSWNSRQARMVSQTAIGRRDMTAHVDAPVSYKYLLPNLRPWPNAGSVNSHVTNVCWRLKCPANYSLRHVSRLL